MNLLKSAFAKWRNPLSIAALTICLGVVDTSAVHAQRGGSSKSNRPSSGNVNVLDKKAADAQESFLRTSADLAREYEELGELEKAQEVLGSMLKLAPDLKQIEDKIKELNEIRLSQNEAGLEIDPSKGWTTARVGVEKGKTIRFQAEGECRLMITQMVDPNGFPTEDVKNDLVKEAPLGSLMGLIVDSKGKSGKPFAIGKQAEISADTSGQLFLKMNVPPQSKCTGKIRVKITGDILTSDTTSAGR